MGNRSPKFVGPGTRSGKNNVRLFTKRTHTLFTGTIMIERIETHTVPRHNPSALFPSSAKTTHVKSGGLKRLGREQRSNVGCTPHKRSDRVLKHDRGSRSYACTDDVCSVFHLGVSYVDFELVGRVEVWDTVYMFIITNSTPVRARGSAPSGGPTATLGGKEYTGNYTRSDPTND